MSNSNDPLMKLVELVNAEIASGSSKDIIVEKLINSGLDPSQAKKFFDTIVKTRDSHFLQVAKYATKSLLIFFILFTVLYLTLDKEGLTRVAKYDFLFFVGLILLFGGLTQIGGKIAAYLRYGASYLIWLSIATLSGLLFLQEAWSVSFIHVSGRWGVVFTAITNFAIWVGPVWIAVFLAVLSLAALLVAWAESDKIKHGIFES
jgi:hypothetical protein